MKRSDFALMACAAAVLAGSIAIAADKEKKAEEAKYTISDVMKKAHKGKGNLLERVKEGKASKEEMAQLIDFYRALTLHEAPKGDQEAWKKRVTELYNASVALGKGDSSAMDALKTASNCKACHTEHRPSDK